MSALGIGPKGRIPGQVRRRSDASLVLGAAAALCLGLACSGGRETRLYPLVSTAPTARNLSVTVDQCDCGACRIALGNPTTLLTAFSQTGLPIGAEVPATTCYVNTSVEVVIECGNCPGPGSCTASVTVHASGDAGGVDLAPTVGCVTPPGSGEQCQAQKTLPIDASVPSTNCTL